MTTHVMIGCQLKSAVVKIKNILTKNSKNHQLMTEKQKYYRRIKLSSQLPLQDEKNVDA